MLQRNLNEEKNSKQFINKREIYVDKYFCRNHEQERVNVMAWRFNKNR